MSTNVALVVGAFGITGFNLIEHLKKCKQFSKIYGIAKREMPKDAFGPQTEYISTDIYDTSSCESAFSKLGDVTHVFFVAWVKKQTEEEQETYNLQMFKNVIDLSQRYAKNLKHVVLQTGTKYYGCHLGPFKVPAREDQERHQGPDFYYKQEDYLKEQASRTNKWTFNIFRPSTIIGFTDVSAMNLGTSLAIYGAIQKELKQPFEYPGKVWDTTVDVTDVHLLCRMILWASFDTKASKNEIFNAVNGDTFHWRDMWSHLASWFGFEAKEVKKTPKKLTEEMKSKEPAWNEMKKKYNLQDTELNQTGTWWFVDAELGRDWDVISDMSKAHSFGWKETKSSKDMFTELFDHLSSQRIIPTREQLLKNSYC